MVIHVVKKGETLWYISRLYGFDVNRIIQVNQLENPDLLLVGQALIIPTNDDYHIVKPGETLSTIARRYGVTVDALARENGITNINLISPGRTLRIPKPVIEVNGYLTQGGDAGRGIISGVGEDLTYVSMFSYRAQADGSLAPMVDAPALEAAKTTRTAPLMALTNIGSSGFSTELAHTILSNTTVQSKLLDNVVSTMKRKGYRGLNVDFEYVSPNDRESYNQFIRLALGRMHANGYSLSAALAPKISANQPGLLYEAHDYPVHGQVDDFIVLMTYEWGWTGGPPMAVAPINRVRQVLDYAVTAIPRSKILMGIPMYGYDWKLPFVWGKTRAEALNPRNALMRAVKYQVQILYDDLAQSPYYRYTDESGSDHIVWFEDARSYAAKYNTVKDYGLRGASYWVLNLSSAQNWPVLTSKFRIRKLV